ncbi:hypothetical protein RHODO2019_18665 (plasmid) [Rhodococcus antarcticus]|uniref:Pyrroloquinoline-quinone binding quinoprotein n=1 Tax=Rhodococcus antarcticus TaxID=2987751 RepID=A0ABY6P5R6_9NOCA|nr:hypothetical protein [Rhodococcus antarcticus]UZJ27015.1 hypothetical protein RHODO2019_18665 [Rhodococcus antarcticus]
MTRPRPRRNSRPGGAATGYLGPDGRLWQVPAYPRPVVVLDTDVVTIDGRRYPVRPGQEPRDAANPVLVELALRLRGEAGAIHADVRTTGSEQSWPVVVTGTGDVFDATPTSSGSGTRRNGRLLLAGGGVLVAVLGLATAVVVVVSTSSAPAATVAVVAGPAPTGTPVPYPQLPPPGFSQTAAWSAPIDPGTTPVITTTGQIVTVSPPGAGERTLDVRDPATGITAWSAVLPRGAGTGSEGVRLSQVEGHESVVATTSTDLTWWPTDGEDHTPRTVALPVGAVVSFAGSTPLVTWPAQHAGILTDSTPTTGAALTDLAVPAGAVAVGATAGTVIAVNSVGQLWRLTPATAQFPPAPVATAALVPGASALESVAAYTAPTPAGATPELLVLTWFTPDPAVRVVSLLDATTGAPVGAPVTVARSDLTGGWQTSEHNTLGTLGRVLLDTTVPALRTLPAGWATTAISDTQVHGSAASTPMVLTPAGVATPTGSGVIPLGVIPTVVIPGAIAAGLAVVTATAGTLTTLYGLPTSTTPAGPTPSVPVPAPPALRPTNPVPSPAPAPTSGAAS